LILVPIESAYATYLLVCSRRQCAQLVTSATYVCHHCATITDLPIFRHF